MRLLLCLCALVVVAAASPIKEFFLRNVQVRAAKCDARYHNTGALRTDKEVHTMCSYPRSSKRQSGGVSAADIKVILDAHNNYRRDPRAGVTAKQMLVMYWDPELAKVAQHYADFCPTYKYDKHDKNRHVPGYGSFVGQNMAWGQRSWNDAIRDWFIEVNDFKFGHGPTNDKVVGHYTQVVKDTSSRVGCGYAVCNGNKHPNVYICNYWTGQTDFKRPFVTGKPCSGCPSSKCVGGTLCDLKGKICHHGTMNYKTGKCTCESLYTGEYCEKLKCSGQGRFCGTAWPPSYCDKYGNVPARCPIMCGVCTSSGQGGERWIPAPAVALTAGTYGTAEKYPAGQPAFSNRKIDFGATTTTTTTKAPLPACRDKTHFEGYCRNTVKAMGFCANPEQFTITGLGTAAEICAKTCNRC